MLSYAHMHHTNIKASQFRSLVLAPREESGSAEQEIECMIFS